MNKAKSKVIKAKSKKVLNVLITYCILIIVAFIFFFPCLSFYDKGLDKLRNVYEFSMLHYYVQFLFHS